MFFFPRRGFVFGLWSACAPVGNILGAFLASSVLNYGYEVRRTQTQTDDTDSNMLICFMLLCAVRLPGNVGGAVCRRGDRILRPACFSKRSW